MKQTKGAAGVFEIEIFNWYIAAEVGHTWQSFENEI